MTRPQLGVPGHLMLAWGVFGVGLILLRAIVGLTPYAVEGLRMGLSPMQWAILAVWVGFMLYSEGYRGFQKQFAPRVVKRSLYAARNPSVLRVLLAPLHAMGLFNATRKRLVVAWGVVFAIVTMVMGVKLLPQPWRGIIDVGVVLGLVYGLGVVLAAYAAALSGREPSIDPDVPQP